MTPCATLASFVRRSYECVQPMPVDQTFHLPWSTLLGIEWIGNRILTGGTDEPESVYSEPHAHRCVLIRLQVPVILLLKGAIVLLFKCEEVSCQLARNELMDEDTTCFNDRLRRLQWLANNSPAGEYPTFPGGLHAKSLFRRGTTLFCVCQVFGEGISWA